VKVSEEVGVPGGMIGREPRLALVYLKEGRKGEKERKVRKGGGKKGNTLERCSVDETKETFEFLFNSSNLSLPQPLNETMSKFPTFKMISLFLRPP